MEFVQPLSLAAVSARARRQRRARRMRQLGLLMRAAAVLLLIGTAGGVYALVSGGPRSRTEIFSGEGAPAVVSAASAPARRHAAAHAAPHAGPSHPRASAPGALPVTTAAAGVTTASASATPAPATTTAPAASAQATTSPASGPASPQATTTSSVTAAVAATTPTAPSATAATDSLTTSEAALDAAAGTLSFDPPAYLMPFYRSLSSRYGISVPVLAALSYVQSGGYDKVLAGQNAAPLAAAARASAAGNTRALDENVIASAASAAAQPSPSLYTAVRRLAASDATSTPALALQSVTQDYPTTDAVLTIAQEIGWLPADAVAKATPAEKITAMLREANLLNGLPYVWGGGHDTPAWLVQGGFDCSGFVSAVLHAAGYLDSPQTTQTLPGQAGISSGPGQYVTIYDRTVNTTTFPTKKKPAPATAGSSNISVSQATSGVHLTKGKHSNSIQVTAAAQKAIQQAEIQKGNEQDNTINDEHVIIEIDGQWWESGGDTGNGGGASVHQIKSVSPSYLKSFNLILHPSGL